MRRRLIISFSLALVAAACSSDGAGQSGVTTLGATSTATSTLESKPAAPTSTVATTVPTIAATFTTTGSIRQLAVIGAEPGQQLAVVDDDDVRVTTELGAPASGVVDSQGSLLFRNLAPGTYRVQSEGSPAPTSDTVVVTDDAAVPAQSFYAEQRVPAPGYGYVTTRDGTTLSVNVSLPGPIDEGPYPTVVEYSGYDPSNPDNTNFAQIYTTLGYAYVGVNIRGTGCSGGSWTFFEPIQSVDGYDLIETIAAQPWVLHNHVGMVGVSYPGISQLFVARSQPPSLAAITPLSVLDDALTGTLYPGGILNTGFAVEWTTQRQNEAQPSGQEWAAARIADGDEVCEANQSLRLQNPDVLQQIRDTPYYDPAIGDPLSPSQFVDRINVPVFMAGAWQDEQTGGRFPTLLDKFTSSPAVFADLGNGFHTESIASSATFARYSEFLDLYVAMRTPSLDRARVVYAVLGSSIAGVDPGPLPDDRFAGQSYDDARQAFEAEPRIRLLLEEGADPGRAIGAPSPRFTISAAAYPVPDTTLRSFSLSAGQLDDSTVSGTGTSSYIADATAVPDTIAPLNGGSMWNATTAFDWPTPPAQNVASFVSAPIVDDVVLVGSSSVDLWITATSDDTDLEVTLTEVRPDGQEMYIQSGWLRASKRALDDAASTPLRPVPTFLEADAAPLGSAEPTLVRIEVLPVAHALRAGSRLRLVVGAPGGNRVTWAFDSIANGETVTIHHDSATPSSLHIGVLAGLDIPAGLAPCGAVRNQPCRTAPGLRP
jgi:uncharacterized protein